MLEQPFKCDNPTYHNHVVVDTYSDLREGFYDSAHILKVYPYLANIEIIVPPGHTVFDVDLKMDAVGFVVYVHIMQGRRPQLWIDASYVCNFVGTKKGEDVVVGSNNDPAPTYVKLSKSYGRGDDAVSLFHMIPRDVRLINCVFNSGNFDNMNNAPYSYIMENCYVTSSSTRARVYLRNIIMTGSVMVSGTNMVITNVQFINAEFSVGNRVNISCCKFNNSKQVLYYDYYTQRSDATHRYTTLIFSSAPESNNTKRAEWPNVTAVNTSFVNAKFTYGVKHFNKCAFIKDCTTTTDITLYKCFIQDCVIDDTYDNSESSVNICMDGCVVNSSTISVNMIHMYNCKFGSGCRFVNCITVDDTDILDDDINYHYLMYKNPEMLGMTVDRRVLNDYLSYYKCLNLDDITVNEYAMDVVSNMKNRLNNVLRLLGNSFANRSVSEHIIRDISTSVLFNINRSDDNAFLQQKLCDIVDYAITNSVPSDTIYQEVML